MSVYYPLSAIEECLPVEYEKDWDDEGAFERPRIINLEFYKLLGSAIKRSEIKIYSANGRLLAPTSENLSLQTYLNQKEVNSWLKANKLSYSWKPEKIKPKTLKTLIESSELKTDCVDMAHALRARGIPAERINRSKVAEELCKTPGYQNYKEDTLEHRIRAKWWKLACPKEVSIEKS